MISIYLADVVATLQQPEFGPQQNDGLGYNRIGTLLQICQRCFDAMHHRLERHGAFTPHRGKVVVIMTDHRRLATKVAAALSRVGSPVGTARADPMDPVRNFRILPATPDDIPEVLAMIRALAEYEKLRHLCIATETALRSALFDANPAAEVIVGWEDRTPAAFALFFHNFSTFLGRKGLYLEDLFVRPPFRGRGYGRALLVYLARIAVNRGCGRFEWAVLDWNAAAIGFYESLGATVLPDWRITRVTGDALQRLAANPILHS